MTIAREITRFTQKEISHIFSNARRVLSSPACVMLMAPTTKKYGRVLCVTPKKIGSAPERNLVRRQVRSIFYEQKLYKYPVDFVIVAKGPFTILSFQEKLELILVTYARSMASAEHRSE